MPTTKIICTLGPASDSITTIRKMAVAGMDVVRLNFSHGTHDEHGRRIELVRTMNRKCRRRIRILQDLEGHRIRVGKLPGGKPLPLKKRQHLWLTTVPSSRDGNAVPIEYSGSLGSIKKGQDVFIDDGNIALKVVKSEKRRLLAEVVVANELKEHKGVNIPGAKLEFGGLKEKDKKDICFGIANRVDYIAQSFVRNRRDMLEVRSLVKDSLPNCKLIAKIESREGILNIDEILRVSDGIMIARGDMGISIPIYEVPVIQKRIIKKCNEENKLVITATQMLESMTRNPIPTRAEVGDVANAILDGTDFVMLSGETAVGDYPVETVDMMNRIIAFTEHSSVVRRTLSVRL